jgi:hypothetical protein
MDFHEYRVSLALASTFQFLLKSNRNFGTQTMTSYVSGRIASVEPYIFMEARSVPNENCRENSLTYFIFVAFFS